MDQQQLAIEKLNGPCLVKAGAGTGKTMTIVKKVVKLIESGINPSEILCLTFSNEATNYLIKKVDEQLIKTSEIAIKTFHSFSASILREFGHLIKVSPDFTILLPDDAKVIMYKDLGVAPNNASRYTKSISTAKDIGITKEDIEEYFKKFKNKFLNIDDLDRFADDLDIEQKILHLKQQYTEDQKNEVKERKEFITQFLEDYKYRDFLIAWDKYDHLKHQKNLLDYSDLNFLVLKLFDNYGSEDVSKKYKYIIVDEFQDTNKLQFDLINHLAQNHKNITVVGDPNQSIYGFRGAFKSSFDEFKKIYNIKDEEIFTLDKSRRSPNTILKTAYSLIKHNYENQNDCMLIENYNNIEGPKVTVIELKNGEEESRKISEIVEKEIEEGTPLKEICILYRNHSQGKLIQQALENKNIPIKIVGSSDLMQKAEIRTTVAYLSILNNLMKRTGTGEQSWWNLFHYHNALIPEDAIQIGRYLKKNREKEESIDYTVILKIDELDISVSGKKIVKRITTKLEEMMKFSNKPLPDIILEVYDLIGLNRMFTYSRSERNIEGTKNLKYFYDFALNFYEMHDKSLQAFIDYIEILEKLEIEIKSSDASKIVNENAISLMTIHAVKGLDFEKVILTNLSKGKFPFTKKQNEPLIPKELNPDIKIYLEKNKIDQKNKKEFKQKIKDYEKKTLLLEERRLCYVAFTRAKKSLILTYARSYNGKEDSTCESDFLREINYKENPNVEFIQDNEEKSTIFAPNSKFEQYKGLLKNQLLEALDTDDFRELLTRLITYHSVREGEISTYDIDLNKLIDKKDLERHISIHHKYKSSLTFDKENFTFSPTELITYYDCPKKYELQYIFQMPERGAFEWRGASIGSFLHEVLEIGVKKLFNSKEQFKAEAEEMSKKQEWQGVDLKDINNLIEVFWARDNNKYNDKTLTEKKFEIELEGFKFKGIADRIDFINETDIEIIDYKTGKQEIDPKKRSWQLGFYAIASKKQLGLNPKKLILEMLRLKKPVEAIVNGDEVTVGREGFKFSEVEKELVDTAKAIMHDYEHEFLPVKEDNPCRNCGYKFYCPKWEDK